MTNSENGRGKFGGTSRTRLIALLAVGVIAAGGATFAAALGQDAPAGKDAQVNPPRTGTAAGKLTEFRAPKAGFRLSYPADWTRLGSTDPDVVLLIGKGSATFQARVLNMKAAVGRNDLNTVKPLTDSIVKANKTAKLLAEPEPVEVGKLPGLFYFYSFRDPVSGRQGAHSHFFLFHERKMITLVFQSVPMTDFRSAADTFDKITASFQVMRS